MNCSAFGERVASNSIILMDGATGTELQRRGVELASTAWSAAAIRTHPELLIDIHREYVAAGAELITANTFRTHARSLQGTPWESLSEELTREAVAIARQATNKATYVAGCIAPLEDCYSPALTPTSTELEHEHAAMVGQLVDAGVDLVLIETQITIREAVIAAQQAAKFDIPFLVSFTCQQNGELLSGESLCDAVNTLLPLQPAGVLVNCLPVDEVLPCLDVMRNLVKLQTSKQRTLFGAYANTGRLMPDGSWESTEGVDPAVYAEFAATWKEFGIGLIGGCCGTTPRHVESIHTTLYGNCQEG